MVHQLFGHCDAESLISLSSLPSLCNFHTHLSAATICKHFPLSCPDCPLGNLQRWKSIFSAPSDPLAIGMEWKVDFKGKWTGPDGHPSPTFQQQLYSFTTVDASSKFVFARLCRNRLSTIAHLEALRLFALDSNRIIRYLCMDNEFITTTAWAASHKMLFISSIPHEHDTVRSIEWVHQTLQEMVVKSLALKPHLSPAFWGLSYLRGYCP